MRSHLGWLTGLAVVLVLAGCSLPARNSVPPELAVASREKIDLSAPPGAYHPINPQTIDRMFSVLTEESHVATVSTNSPNPTNPPLNVLVLSGGGMYGAYSAGVLAGWSSAGTRPKFDCVTGVSTGSLIATFAFLGPQYDEVLRHFYTTVTPKQIYRSRLTLSIL